MSTRSERRQHKATLASLPGPSACSYGVHDFVRLGPSPWAVMLHEHSCTRCGARYTERDQICQCQPAPETPTPAGGTA